MAAFRQIGCFLPCGRFKCIWNPRDMLLSRLNSVRSKHVAHDFRLCPPIGLRSMFCASSREQFKSSGINFFVYAIVFDQCVVNVPKYK